MSLLNYIILKLSSVFDTLSVKTVTYLSSVTMQPPSSSKKV